MSLLDRIKSLLGGGGDARAGERGDERPLGPEAATGSGTGLPPSPTDPLGTPVPETAPDETPPPRTD